MFGIGFQEMLIILVVVLIFFGPKRLPDLAKSLGKGIAEFKKASDEIRKGIDEAVKEGESAAQAGTGAATTPDALQSPLERGGEDAGAAGVGPAQGTVPPGHDARSASETADAKTSAPRDEPGGPPSAPAG